MSVKGAIEFKRFKEGNPLSRKQAILAHCYECNGFEAQDCLGTDCPLYQYHPWQKVSLFSLLNKKILDPKHLKKMQEGRIRAKQQQSTEKKI
jgi:hypothetical protein